MHRIISILSALLFAGQVLSAELEQELERCAGVKSNLERLTCYDALARERLNTGPAPEYGKWELRISQNPFDDTTTVLLVLRSDSGKTPEGKPVAMVLRCESGDTDAYINWGTFLGRDMTELRYRIGGASDQTAKWRISTDNSATFHPGSPRRFIESLMSADRFVVQVVPVNTIPIRAEFDLRGLSQAIEPLQRTCN